MSTLLVECCRCGTRFEADSSDPDILAAVASHRRRCGGEVEWGLLVPGHIDRIETHISVGYREP